MHSRSASRNASRLVLGVAVIGLGVAFTLDNLGWLDARALFDYWPLVFVLLGLVRFSSGSYLSGLVWALVGVLLVLDNLEIIDVDVADLAPLVLVFVGYHIVRRALGHSRRLTEGESSSQISCFAFMSGQQRRATGPDFRGGDVTSVMGGSEIDLREATLEEGKEGVMDVFALMGGIDIRVPPDWTVSPEVSAFLGGFEDKTDGAKADPSKRFTIRGMALMGGVCLRN